MRPALCIFGFLLHHAGKITCYRPVVCLKTMYYWCRAYSISNFRFVPLYTILSVFSFRDINI